MEYKDWIALIPSSIQTIVVIISASWAIILYTKQKNDAFESGKQLNRANLTDAYMRWHSAILSSDKNISIASRLIRKSHRVLSGDRDKISIEQTHAIHVLYMLLNVLYLEWNYRITYKLSMDGFDKTVDFGLGGIVKNPDRDFLDIAQNFEKIFCDFPEEFTSYIANRLRSIS